MTEVKGQKEEAKGKEKEDKEKKKEEMIILRTDGHTDQSKIMDNHR